MFVEDCISYREQTLIVIGTVVIIVQMVIYYIERRHFRQLLNSRFPPTPPVDYDHRD